MSINEQVKELRKYSSNNFDYGARLAKKAADTIESLSEKLQEANMERSDRYYGEGKKLIEEMAEEIENCYGRETELSDRAREYLLKADYSGGWIPCSEPPKHTNEVLIFNGKSYSVGYYDEKTWVNAIHPVEWQEIRHEP